MNITVDAETKSYADLLKVGAWAYGEHLTTEIICLCYAFGGGEILSWHPGLPPPERLFQAIRDGATVKAHNVAFELSLWHNILAVRYGWPIPKIYQWRDTMAVAAYKALPQALDPLCRVLGLGSKDPEGARLITKYSKLYLKTAKPVIPPEDFAKWITYCKGDVALERAVSQTLGALPRAEQENFTRDLETGLRGLALNMEGVEAATEVVDKRAAELEDEFFKLTGYSPGQVAKVLAWLNERGAGLENLQADTLADALDDAELPQGDLRRAIEIRVEISKASTRKLDAMARQVGNDGRARFQTRYHGTVTGRNTGSGFQPLNLNRGFDDIADADKAEFPTRLVRNIMHRDPDWLDAVYGDAMDAVAKASRYWIVPAPGHRIMAGDFSSIEAIILAGLAGEQWKLDLFRQKVKIYGRTADKIYGLPEGTVKKGDPRYQDGKRGELAFGYQGALGAWLKFDRHPIHSDETIIGFCRSWRKDHPATVKFWRNLEDASIRAMQQPGEECSVEPSGIFYVRDGQWLLMVLPDGKELSYFDPQLRVGMPKWHQPGQKPDCAAGTCRCEPRPHLTYMARKEGQWKRVATYGGKDAENATQAVSRQILEGAKKRCTEAGYPVILTVYDEVVAEVREGFGSAAELKALMCASPGRWADGWPIDIDVWEGPCYRK